jgi:predicted transcriptional regulator
VTPPQKVPGQTNMTVRLPDDLVEQLDAIGAVTGESRNALLIRGARQLVRESNSDPVHQRRVLEYVARERQRLDRIAGLPR